MRPSGVKRGVLDGLADGEHVDAVAPRSLAVDIEGPLNARRRSVVLDIDDLRVGRELGLDQVRSRIQRFGIVAPHLDLDGLSSGRTLLGGPHLGLNAGDIGDTAFNLCGKLRTLQTQANPFLVLYELHLQGPDGVIRCAKSTANAAAAAAGTHEEGLNPLHPLKAGLDLLNQGILGRSVQVAPGFHIDLYALRILVEEELDPMGRLGKPDADHEHHQEGGGQDPEGVVGQEVDRPGVPAHEA